jgi:hypothetical protein
VFPLYLDAYPAPLGGSRDGKVLVRLKTRRRPDGGLISVGSTRFVFNPGGLRLVAGRRYRVVAVYDNPGAETIPAGAMAFIAGPYIPDDAAAWPAIDPGDALFQEDLAGMAGQVAGS